MKRETQIDALQAREITAHIKQRALDLAANRWLLALEVQAALDRHIHEAVELSAVAWLRACFGDSWQKIYRMMQIVRGLPGVPTEVLVRLDPVNAWRLLELPEAERKSNRWLQLAAELKNSDFRAAVDHELETKYRVKKERMIPISKALGFSTVPQSFAAVVVGAVELALAVEEVDPTTKAGRLDAVESIFAKYLTSTKGGDAQ